ncbi:zinc dependent phospholipase C family protein [bacterium]|nr:zinc dependent phospholipase C family protein [bacterium]
MAGAYWHFLAAIELIDQIHTIKDQHQGFAAILQHKETFLAGVQGPDFNFYPGGDRKISLLSHEPNPADVGRALLNFAKTDREKAFAYGWLMHLTTDHITHPLVHTMMREHFYGKCRNGTDHSVYPLGHHRVEWGIDVFLLQEKSVYPLLPGLSEILPSALDLATFANQAFKEVYDYPFTATDWEGSIKGMIKYEEIFKVVWRLSGRFKDTNPIRQGLKDILYHLLLTPILKVAAIRTPDNGAGVFLPIKPTTADFERIRFHNERACKAFLLFIPENFAKLENNVT